MRDADLVSFTEAQAPIYTRVVEELTKGRKRTHWMWFIFPQIAGLGRSTVAQHYAIRDLDQARRYLADPILGLRLREVVKLIIDQKAKSALEILGSPDDLKFRSCLTLFRQAASDHSDRALFARARDLRENEPHPMGPLPSLGKLLNHSRVDRSLSVQEANEISIRHWCAARATATRCLIRTHQSLSISKGAVPVLPVGAFECYPANAARGRA